MRKIIIVLVLIIAGLSIKAQYPGYTALADAATFKSAFAAASLKTNAIKSDFVQDKNLAMLAEKITSKGKFWFKKESRVRMEYIQPYQYLMIINKDNIYVKDGQKENRISTKSNKMFQQINKIMIDCMQGTALNNANFKTRLFENKTTVLVELVPITKSLKDMFETIKVAVDKKDFSVASIEMIEPGGDNTLIRFINKELNANIPDALFTIN